MCIYSCVFCRPAIVRGEFQPMYVIWMHFAFCNIRNEKEKAEQSKMKMKKRVATNCGLPLLLFDSRCCHHWFLHQIIQSNFMTHAFYLLQMTLISFCFFFVLLFFVLRVHQCIMNQLVVCGARNALCLFFIAFACSIEAYKDIKFYSHASKIAFCPSHLD